MLRRVAVIVGVSAAAAVAAAEPQRLTTDMLNDTVAGSVIELDTPIGTKIPMRFGRDGLVSGEAGVLASFLGAAKDRGRWWVKDDRLCIKWFRWFNSEPRCMEIRAEGTRVHWRQADGDTGTGTLTERGAPAVAAKSPPKPKAESASVIESEKSAVVAQAGPVSSGPAAELSASPAPAAAPAKPVPAAALGGPVLEPSDPAPLLAEPVEAAPKPAATRAPPAAETASVTSQEAPAASRAAALAKPKAKAAGTSAASTATRKSPTPPSAAAPAPSFRVARVEASDMLNVRSGPSEGHPAVGVISARGRGVRIVGACVADWCPVRHGGVNGWVNRFYLSAE